MSKVQVLDAIEWAEELVIRFTRRNRDAYAHPTLVAYHATMDRAQAARSTGNLLSAYTLVIEAQALVA